MNWFTGTISEGISLARDKDGIFVVYVYDQSDLSKSLDEKLKCDEISTVLFSESFVPMRFENNSSEATQFSQIYPLVIIPSIFFIRATTGIPLEIIGADIESSALIEKIRTIRGGIDKGLPTACPSSSEPVGSSSEGSSINQAEDDDKLECTSNETVVVKSDSTESTPIQCSSTEILPMDIQSSSCTQDESLSVEDKVARVQNLLKEKQRLKDLEKIEEDKKNELERRVIGQNMEKMQRKKNEDDMSQLALERRREKDEERKARERVKAQIAADKADKEARAAILRGEEPIKPASQEVPTIDNQHANVQNSMTRIKFRFLDNSSSLGKFENGAFLSEVVQHIRTTSNIQHFSLSSVLHQRKFNEVDMSKSLSELGLTPSAILLVTPRTSSSPNNIVPKGWSPVDIFWTLMSPITSLINFIGSVFGLTNASNSRRNDDNSAQEGQEAKRPRMEREGLRNRGQKPPVRSEGNIHRLNQPGDSEDDDNNTWNGNSTQQM